MFSGSIVALATPFTKDNAVDFPAFGSLIEWHIAEGTSAVVLCGTTGEAPTLSHDEQIKMIKEGVKISKGRIPVIAGTGGYDTRSSVMNTKAAKECGADACLIILPYYNRPTPEGCLAHFIEIGKTGFPMIVYHHPGRTGIKLPAKMLAQICEIPSVVAVKEASGDLDYAIELMQKTSRPLLSGDDTLTIPLMASGAVGVISIVANVIPREWVRLTALLASSSLAGAQEHFKRFYSLCKAMVLETNPQCVKYALSLMGKCQSMMRLPLLEPQEMHKMQIRAEMEKAGLLSKRALLEELQIR
ncbi:MAG TPA: 4-hydroxy-tetrahydrodipicolinate synthase [Rhabdochlamydiaceae bacterium]|nr:4-hydroxy-tetrahydrodipicolinate synthase [Rhabdochlamydiaceae bacterium]